MKTRAILAAATVAFALTALPISAHAQLVGVPVGEVPLVYAPAYAGYAPQIALPGCQVVRQQFDDVYGWRVRDVLVCSPRQTFGQ
jgi:hypothetical protein